MVQRAQEEVEALGHPAPSRIEFAVREGVERYESVEEMIEFVPANTLRLFSSARVQVGGDALFVEMRFGRGRYQPFRNPAFSCRPGVTVEVKSDDAVEKAELERVRDSLADVVGRGGFFWARRPTVGPADEGESLETTVKSRWSTRQIVAQEVFLAVAMILLVLPTLIDLLFPGKDVQDAVFPDVIPGWAYGAGVAAIAQLISYPLSPLIFPAIEIADTSPGRRIFQVIGRSGVVTTAVGLAIKAVFSAP